MTKPSLRTNYKRRFAMLPLYAMQRERRRADQKNTQAQYRSYAVRCGVLRSALRRRRKDRVFMDLRLAVLQRRLPREKVLRAKTARRLKRTRLSGRRGAFHKKVLARRVRTLALWGMRRMEITSTKRHYRAAAVLHKTVSGESISFLRNIVRLDRRAMYGFQVALTKKRASLRRKARDSKKRQLRGWRRGRLISFKSLFMFTKHWSEGKNTHRLSALSAYQRPRFVKRFLRKNGRAMSAAVNSPASSAAFVTTSFPKLPSPSEIDAAANTDLLSLAHFGRATTVASTATPVATPVVAPAKRVFFKKRKTPSRWVRRQLARDKRLNPRLKQEEPVALYQKEYYAAARRVSSPTAVGVSSNRATALVDFTPTQAETANISSLHFQTPTIKVIQSAQEKQDDLIADIVAREKPYQLTSQYVESLTAFIPELINAVVSTRILKNQEKLPFDITKHVIQNIYWGLRVYLNVDPFDTRFRLRDDNPGVRLLTIKTMEAAAESHIVAQPHRAALRYRFQPGRVLRAQNKLRFRSDWLRVFLPKNFALYQENSKEYGLFLLRTFDIRRLRAGSRGIASWWTTLPSVAVETRMRRVLSRRYSRNTPRFETLLQTVRRPTLREALPSANVAGVKNNFFTRSYSTVTSACLISKLTTRALRAIPESSSLLSSSQIVAKRYRVVPLSEARDSTQYTKIMRGGVSPTRMDSRFTRAKSPRSRQYVLRMQGRVSSVADLVGRYIDISANLLSIAEQGRHVYRARRLIRASFLTTKQNAHSAVQQNRTAANFSMRKAAQRSSSSSRRQYARLLPKFAFARRTASVQDGVRKETAPLQSVSVASHIMNANTQRFAAACTQIARQERAALFDAFRARLWYRLTNRKMKRHRIARHWLKGASRWLRDPWLADIVSVQANKGGLLAGELRAREQQIGEYVADVDDSGRDIPQERALRERHAFVSRPAQKLPELNKVARARGLDKTFARQRLKVSKWVRRKPIPTLWLANYECNEFMKEYAQDKTKKSVERVADEHARTLAAHKRRVRGLPPEQPKREPLKVPALYWLPHIIWKEIQRRIRQFEWRESDGAFERQGFRNAFRFHPAERNRAPWLEALIYTRATFSTRLGEFRRRAFPREQKKYKWLQRYRRAFLRTRGMRYLKWRHWPRLRSYNQRLYRSLFSLPTRRAARKHFEKLNARARPSISGFVDSTRGLNDRLDVTLVHLKVVPSVFWAKVVAPLGLLKINGKIICDPAFRLPSNSVVQPLWGRISRFQHFFQPSLSRRDAYKRRTRKSTSSYPKNFEYFRGTSTIVYKHAPRENDLRRSDRVQPHMFRWFKLDSV